MERAAIERAVASERGGVLDVISRELKVRNEKYD
jgi:hypothetical protein